jgi:predicted nucleic acid-binding protein
MKAPGVVVADTTPLNYLIVIDRADILASLFGEVLIPGAVLEELRHPKAPAAVSRWLQQLPGWLRVTPARQMDETMQLGKGENEAISLALERHVKVVLMDERLGRGAAEARGLIPVGTLNLIDLADEQGIIDGIAALNDLRQTTFRADPELLERFVARMRARKD